MDKTEVLEYLHYIPITIFVAFPTTVILTYAIAVVLGHVDGAFPYISDTTTYPPESCIFAQAMNMIAVLMCVFVYIRYGQIKECTTEFRSNASLPYWNRAAFILGLLTNLGLSIVANFQETSSLVVHLIGAFMCFGGGTLYFWSQAVCSYYLQPVGCSLKLAHARLALSVLATICFVVGLICGILSFRIPAGHHAEKSSEMVRSNLHLASTIAEWLCAVTFCCNVLTFIEEFHTTQLSCPRVSYNPGGAMTISNEILNVCQEDGVTRLEQGSPNTGRSLS